jgi:trehalose synthase
MLQTVDVGTQSVDAYRVSAGEDVVAELRALAEPLRGARILHVSATPYGGGVAELLRSEIPMLRDLGIDADWKLIRGDDAFFRVTKLLHNGLQGSPEGITTQDQERYLTQSAANAEALDEDGYDVVMVHDPQPLALPELHGRGDTRWIWRCHIDTSEPNPEVWNFLRPFLVSYDAAVFTLGGFVPPDFPLSRVEIIPPAIDPESPKNLEIDHALATRVLGWLGLDMSKPFVAQVSRFDPWKDPLGVIGAYRLVRAEVPNLQLALAGSMALDDPQGWDMYRAIHEETLNEPDIHVFTNLTGVGNIEVNALQRLAAVVIQKSVREGFGLVVSESLWKKTPVVASRAGGIPLQLQNGSGGYLVDSIPECAARVCELLRDPDQRHEIGGRGHERVRERFLLTRLVADSLRLYTSILGSEPPTATTHVSAIDGEPRDPVCGARVNPDSARQLVFAGAVHQFCSRACEEQFALDPDRFLRAVPHPAERRFRWGRWPRRIADRARRKRPDPGTRSPSTDPKR